MAASLSCCSSPSITITTTNPPFFTLFLPFLLLSFSLLSLSLFFFRRLKTTPLYHHNVLQSQISITTLKNSLSKLSINTHHFNSTRSILLDVNGDGDGDGDDGDFGSGFNSGGDERKKKKKKRKKGKKKDVGFENGGVKIENEKLVCLYPFTSSSSATQRKIKQHYDQLVKSHNHSNGLTLAQVGEFVNCLVDARNELQLKSDCIKRKFTITKALLLKADRSSFDRLRKQIYKLEVEQKRLEEDAFVYNWLQHQLKLSPAYKKMIEIGTSMELKAKAGELTESPDGEQNDISFEEFLAQEKKDAFWQKYSKPKPSSA